MKCDFCFVPSEHRQCSTIHVCSTCVRVLQESTGAALRIRNLETQLAEERGQLTTWRRTAQQARAHVEELEHQCEQLRHENKRLEESGAELIEAVENAMDE